MSKCILSFLSSRFRHSCSLRELLITTSNKNKFQILQLCKQSCYVQWNFKLNWPIITTFLDSTYNTKKLKSVISFELNSLQTVQFRPMILQTYQSENKAMKSFCILNSTQQIYPLLGHKNSGRKFYRMSG